ENVEILMDKSRFKQIMYNLLSNTMKYLNKDGKVIVSLIKESKYVKITVEDNGTGIKEEDLPFIFERFYRADISRNSETGGTGLGLSITKSLVEAHGGRIYARSQIGKGTKFTILLPI
ncbi:MAG: sensor histidine kinase, partial [Tissierellia bacterium]|nr:sensor histidine kinase [Tissierellia bacterium]